MTMMPTPGDWQPRMTTNLLPCNPGIVSDNEFVVGIFIRRADRDLALEAGTVFHEIGLTPRELQKQRDELLAALKRADQFITNGIGLGFIRMPDAGTPDTAHETPAIIRAAVASVKGGAK